MGRTASGRVLEELAEGARADLEAAHRAREEGLSACRAVIQASSRAIRAIHRRQPEAAEDMLAEAKAALRRAQAVLYPHQAVAHSGFLHDAEKEMAEAHLTRALVEACETACAHPGGTRTLRLPGPGALRVGVPAWLNGLAEAASELRRHLLDRLRGGSVEEAEEMLGAMEDVYDVLVSVDYPEAITGGLRRTTDALRAVLERSRSDVTTTVLQLRLQDSLRAAGARDGGTQG